MKVQDVGFGTSGVRGRVEDLTDAVCMAYTRAFLQMVEVLDSLSAGRTVALGIDLRPSSPAIATACAAAVRKAGYAVEYCGILPTPALAFHARSRGLPAVMVTGSHIPFDRNGIKFYRASGEISKAEEAMIPVVRYTAPFAKPLGKLHGLGRSRRLAYVSEDDAGISCHLF